MTKYHVEAVNIMKKKTQTAEKRLVELVKLSGVMQIAAKYAKMDRTEINTFALALAKGLLSDKKLIKAIVTERVEVDEEEIEKILDRFTYKGISGHDKLIWRKEARLIIAKEIAAKQNKIWRVKEEETDEDKQCPDCGKTLAEGACFYCKKD